MSNEPKPVEGNFVYLNGKKCHEKVYQWIDVSPYPGPDSVKISYATINNVKVKKP